MVISLPFTTPSLAALSYNKPSIYYAPTDLLTGNHLTINKLNEIQIIKTKKELKIWIETNSKNRI